jgi:hypothetical protein
MPAEHSRDWKSCDAAPSYSPSSVGSVDGHTVAVLGQFVSAASGRVNRSLALLLQVAGGSWRDVVSGRINMLFPHIANFNAQIKGVIDRAERGHLSAQMHDRRIEAGAASPWRIRMMRVALLAPRIASSLRTLASAICWRYLGKTSRWGSSVAVVSQDRRHWPCVQLLGGHCGGKASQRSLEGAATVFVWVRNPGEDKRVAADRSASISAQAAWNTAVIGVSSAFSAPGRLKRRWATAPSRQCSTLPPSGRSG